VSSLKILLYNIPDVDEAFSIGALWRQWECMTKKSDHLFKKLWEMTSLLWRSTWFYIVTFVHWNIVFIESCMYKSVLGKINKLQKKTQEVKTNWTSFWCGKHRAYNSLNLLEKLIRSFVQEALRDDVIKISM
jgi:hypothetical protein